MFQPSAQFGFCGLPHAALLGRVWFRLLFSSVAQFFTYQFCQVQIFGFIRCTASHFGFPASLSLHLWDLGFPMCYSDKVQLEMLVGFQELTVGVYSLPRTSFWGLKFAIPCCC